MTNTNSPIQWTDVTWSPVVGCKRVSAGCDHCYAFELHDRRHIAWKRGNWPTAPKQYHKPFSTVQLMPERLKDPLRWRKPRRVFVDSMADLFHEAVSDEFLLQVFGIMAMTPQHTYQVLTKRPERMRDWVSSHTHEQCAAWACDYLSKLQPRTFTRAVESIGAGWPWPLPNVWLGVSVENQQAADERIPVLLETPAAIRFLSCEPLLGPVNLREYVQLTETNIWDYGDDRTWGYDAWSGGFASEHQSHSVYNPQPGIHWIIIGGESGKHARLMNPEWACVLVKQCRAADVAPFVKQLGSELAYLFSLKDRHGGNMEEWPPDYPELRVREFPQMAHGDAA